MILSDVSIKRPVLAAVLSILLIAFGLLTASLIVLFVLPAIYAVLDDLGLSTLAQERKLAEQAHK